MRRGRPVRQGPLVPPLGAYWRYLPDGRARTLARESTYEEEAT